MASQISSGEKGPAASPRDPWEWLPAVIEALRGRDWARAEDLAGRIDWSQSKSQKKAFAQFWARLPMALQPAIGDARPGADQAASALAQTPGFLVALNGALVDLDAATVFSSSQMGELALKAIKTRPVGEQRETAAQLAMTLTASRVNLKSLQLFEEHGFGVGESLASHKKTIVLNHWRIRGAALPRGNRAERALVSMAAQLEKAARCLHWLEEHEWIDTKDYPKGVDNATRFGLPDETKDVARQTARNGGEALTTKALIERMGGEAPEHPHWTEWQDKIERRGSHPLACDEWRMMAAWTQAGALGRVVTEVSGARETSAKKKGAKTTQDGSAPKAKSALRV